MTAAQAWLPLLTLDVEGDTARLEDLCQLIDHARDRAEAVAAMTQASRVYWPHVEDGSNTADMDQAYGCCTSGYSAHSLVRWGR